MTDNQDSKIIWGAQAKEALRREAYTPPTDRPLTAGDLALSALRLHDEYLSIPQDRGGPNGTKGRAHQAWLDAKASALTARPATSAASEGEGADDSISLFETVCEYLLGEGPLRGQQFGDEPPTMKSGRLARYWWRHDLREARDQIIAALASPPVSERERELEGLVVELLKHSVSLYGNPNDDDHGIGLIHARARALTAQPAGEPTHG